MSYHLIAEGIVPRFLFYLKEKDVLEDFKIKKEIARKIFMEEFKPQYSIVKFPFSNLYRLMYRQFKLLHNECIKTDEIYFKEHRFNLFIRYYTKSDLERNATAIPRCHLCNENFSSEILLRVHEHTEQHLQKKTISENEGSAAADVIVEVGNTHGSSPETVVLRPQKQKSIILNVVNNSTCDYTILQINESNRSSYISLENSDKKIPARSKLCVTLRTLFDESTVYSYLITFRVRNETNGTDSEIVKEIIFQVHSELLDDLHTGRPFQGVRQENLRKCEYEIVPGEIPAYKTLTRFVPQIKLPPYRLPLHIELLLDNDLREFPNITSNEKGMLHSITRLMESYWECDSLNLENYYAMNKLRLHMEEYQMNINIHSYDVKNQVLRSIARSPKNILELSVPGLAEHRPSILRGDSVFVRVSEESTIRYEGIVHQVKQDSVILGFSRRFSENVHLENMKYLVSFSFNRMPLRVEHQANDLIRKHGVTQFLCPERLEEKLLIFDNLIWYNKDIERNEKQQEAVKHIVSATSGSIPYLIFGPPGTGKTVTVVEAILQITKLKPELNILVSAPSNYAADEITKRLVKYIQKKNLIRYVAPSYSYELIDDTVKPYTNFNNELYHPSNSELLKYSVVVTTLITAARLVNGGTPPEHFSYVFIDESGHATETETLVPIAGILSSEQSAKISGQIVLAGDPKQLGPIIHSQKAISVGFGISMLERLMTTCALYSKSTEGSYNANVLTKLIQSYRCHRAILKQPNQLFYDNELIPPPEDSELINVALGWDELPNKEFPLIFHSVMGKDEREDTSPSFFNLQEIDLVIRYLEKLIGNRLKGMKIAESHIGVITPYRQQAQKLRMACKKKKWDKLSIGSVEQFQGQERLIIIVSTVRSDPKFTAKDAKFHLGFLKNPKRLNVAITRAKALLIVVGNPLLLQLDEYWKSFIKYCKDNGGVAGTPFEIYDTSTVPNGLPSTSGTTNEQDDEAANFSRGNT